MEQSNSEEINHPSYYRKRGGAECIDVAETFNFNLGNVCKYIWRADEKHEDPLIDLQKAKWYIEREIERIQTGVHR